MCLLNDITEITMRKSIVYYAYFTYFDLLGIHFFKVTEKCIKIVLSLFGMYQNVNRWGRGGGGALFVTNLS